VNNTLPSNSTGFTVSVSDSMNLANTTLNYDNGTGGASWYSISNTSLSARARLHELRSSDQCRTGK
jgi:hypothetical protein